MMVKPQQKVSTRSRGTDALAPEAVGVKLVLTEELVPNPHNPRMLFDKVPMKALHGSIAKVGILVPLTVYWDKKRKRYVILDGQRRWISAGALGIPSVPVNQVAEPSLVQNIVTMFQIHKVREDWELMPTALKLEVLMRELRERNESKLAALTGLDQAVVSRCKKLLSFKRAYQDLMLAPDPADRVKADFFIELYAVRNDRFVNSLDWFDKDKFTDAMLEKYLVARAMKSVTEFRAIKQYINNARKAGKDREIAKRFKQFVESADIRVEHLHLAEADVSVGARKTLGSVNGLYDSVEQIDVEQYYGEEELWSRLEALAELIRRKLREVGRRVGA